MPILRLLPFVSTACLALASAASAGEPVHWSFNEQTEGDDVFWTSPSAVDNTAPRYDFAYEITRLEIRVRWIGIPFDFDVTKEIPPELRTGSAIVNGPPPIVLFQGEIVYPLPPEDPGIAAELDLQIDADGFGQLAMTNIVLGEIEVEIPPFGTQTVQLERITMSGDVDVTPLGPSGDVDGDGFVGFADLLLVLSGWGACPDPPDPCPADVNGNGVVDFDDVLEVLSQWGDSYKGC